jgi:hypothetical protein
MRTGKCVVCGDPIRLNAASSSTPTHRDCRRGAVVLGPDDLAELRDLAEHEGKKPTDPTADRTAYLRGVLAQIQEAIDDAPVDKRAPLFAQLLACEQRIAALADRPGAAKAGDPVDEVSARRAARGGATSRLGHAAGRPR